MWWFKEWCWSLGNNWSVAIISVNALTCFETLLIWFLFLFYLAHEYDYRRRVISKSFQYQLRLSDKQALVGKFFCFVAFVHFQLHLFFLRCIVTNPELLLRGQIQVARMYFLNFLLRNFFFCRTCLAESCAYKALNQMLNSFPSWTR